jgi:HK97 family phage prohead protease
MTTLRQRSAAVATVTRSFALEDITVRSSGDGRTVDAYAAVFDQPSEIHDQDGHYNERIGHGAFDRTLAHRGTRFGVFYNHGRTLYGTPSERASVPLGTPLEVRADKHGVFTSTRYNRGAHTDEILESIRNGDITGQSFTGRMLRSTPARGPFRMRNGELTTVTRDEIALIEYGPTPFPAYDTASIVGTRAVTLSDTDSMLLQLILENLAEGDRALDPIVDALTKTDQALDQAQAVIAQILGEPNPDEDAGMDPERSQYLTRLRSLATLLETKTGTPADAGRASADSPDGHSGPILTRTQIRARLHRIGVLS